MATSIVPRKARHIRHARIRKKIRGTSERPRLCIFRSLKNIYAQIIDDELGQTIATASTLDPKIKTDTNGKAKLLAASSTGLSIANKAKEKGITQVVFDRGGYKYHGRVKALAEAAREAGLQF